MYFTILIYYFLYLIFLFGLIPADALFYLRPVFSLLLTGLFTVPIVFIKKRYLPIVIFLINIGAIFILGEFARVSIKTTFTLAVFTTVILLFLYLKNRITRIIGYLLLLFILFLALWQGDKIEYISNLEVSKIDQTSKNFFTYGLESEIPTYSIDSSAYYKGNSGLAKWYDNAHWKLTTELPLNGRVFYPDKPGKYPLIVIVHGNHLAENPSQFGYDYLLKYFADSGYIAVSIDQNFLNGNWTTLGMGLPKENDARGYLILEHLKLLQEWNTDPESKLYKMIDMENIGLIGHSRGGEAISIAAEKGPGFKIKALMALSPTDRQFRENIFLKDISYITLHGANDGDLISFKGRGQYNRTSFTNDRFNFKASYYIEGINHVQFNSDWGDIDSAGLGKLFYGKNRNIKAPDQREISKELGLKFFDITLKNKQELLTYIKTPSKLETLPSIQIITDYNDSSYISIYDFEKPLNETTFITNQINYSYEYRRFNRALSIKGDKGSSITFKNPGSNSNVSSLNISIASNSYDDQDITISLLYNDSIVSKKEIKLDHALKKNTFKTEIFQKETTILESHFQWFEIQTDIWDELKIELKSDNTSILLDNIVYTP